MKNNIEVSRIDYISNLFAGLCYATIRKIIGREKFCRKKYNGASILKYSEGNDFIKNAIEKGEPFAVARFGDTELRNVLYYLDRRIRKKNPYPEYARNAIKDCSGFFPNTDENIDKFSEVLLDNLKEIDVLAVWFNLMEDYIYRKFGPKEQVCVCLDTLSPFWSELPWTSALKGKKVLVIHPFTETIKMQYEKREMLFDNHNMLPEFELLTLKAVQTLGGQSDEFETWFDALDYMYREAMKLDFEIAIIGCGAYGLPLTGMIKAAGKIAVHTAGVTQMLFGIKGNRWDVKPRFAALYNEHWVRPSETEKIKTADKVEGACYW